MTKLEKSLHKFMLKYPNIPTHTLNGLLKYWVQRAPIGDFLTAMLSNNLMESFQRADDHNRLTMYGICIFIYCEMPSDSHGSVEKVEKWLNDD